MSNRNVIVPTNIQDLLKVGTTSEEEAHVEHEVSLQDIVLNIRMSEIQKGQRAGEIVPNVWLRTIVRNSAGEDTGERKALLFFPLVGARYSGIYGGHNETSFNELFGEVIKALKEEKVAQLAGASSTPASIDDDQPF